MNTVQSSFRLSESPVGLVVTRNWLNVHALAGFGCILVGCLFAWYSVAQLSQNSRGGAALGGGAALIFIGPGALVLQAGQHRGPSRVIVDRERRQVDLGGRVLPFSKVARVSSEARRGCGRPLWHRPPSEQLLHACVSAHEGRPTLRAWSHRGRRSGSGAGDTPRGLLRTSNAWERRVASMGIRALRAGHDRVVGCGAWLRLRGR